MVLPVQIGKVIFRNVTDTIRTVGNIAAEQRVVITSEVDGRVQSLPVAEGHEVKAGQVLARIDDREYRLEVERLRAEQISLRKEHEKALSGLRPEEKEKLKAQMKADESALDLALKEQERMAQLVKDGVLSQSILDEANDKVARARETLRGSQAALTAGESSREEDILKAQSDLDSLTKRLGLAKLNRTKTVIRAPFDGVVISKKIEVGAYAGAGTPVLEMIGSSRLKAILEVPQSYRGKLDRISGVDFYVEELSLKFSIDSDPRRHIRVIPDANIFSGNIRVQVDIPDHHPELFPGLSLEGHLKFDTRKNVKHVPSISLVITERGTVVYTMENGKAKLVPVRASRERDNLVEVDDFTRQLNRETKLILKGSGAVFPGVKVLPTNPEPEAKPPFNAADKEKGRPREGPRGT
ncbi:MAG: HlyD family efflux transporter periplasmic adaptor subunit [Nitrospinaceae bacterium]|nr:HlyD family efflux transporter periplasmic adaptor subunit [Nitrospinaceae bacterium]NIR56283.1 HlyD family efflux transporter periplasmic adaptor subunit [Nitrospinaceae bacterium]NIS86740.1 HlyD family efflux transporter periplasmic adaptor subunit [Nitrospinaceae bacterium]NIT83575.1 HlyD family efflux transporter periplasmic adaptor subunit [Nitrospinaceae bacterium]NIU45777.1 HlyD family efflux transporter periplasmic adaptor subunit [Nitrospinaceae bacterium]